MVVRGVEGDCVAFGEREYGLEGVSDWRAPLLELPTRATRLYSSTKLG